MTPRKHSSRHKTNTYMNSKRLWQNTQYLHRCKADKISELKGPRGHEIPPSTKKLFAIYTCWERECRVSPENCHCVYQSSSRKRSHAQEMLPNSNQTPCFFVYDLFCFLSYCGFCLFGWFQFGVGEKERELEVRWIGRFGESEKSWGRGKCKIWIIREELGEEKNIIKAHYLKN